MNAVISPCGQYRYQLKRQLQGIGSRASVFMVNPSTADATDDDATIRKLIGFGQRLNWSSFTVGNIFAARATDVNDLRKIVDPFGPMVDGYNLATMIETDLTVVAWGAGGKLPLSLRGKYATIVQFAKMLNRDLYCWGFCQDGEPIHPVMIGYDRQLTKWETYL